MGRDSKLGSCKADDDVIATCADGTFMSALICMTELNGNQRLIKNRIGAKPTISGR